MTEADSIIIATAIAVVGVIIIGVAGRAADWQEARAPRFATAVTFLRGLASRPHTAGPPP
jgi:hypothetical protein